MSASAFDAANNLIFYVNFNGNGLRTLYDADNQSRGTLGYIVNPNKSTGETDWVGPGKETVIVPVPGACSKYYLFYTLAGNFTNVVAYAIIDCSTGIPTIATQSTRLNAGLVYGGVAPGLAATKLANGIRKLYVTSGASIISCDITGSGLDAPISLTGNSASGGSCEAEVSPDGKYVAWGSVTSGVVYLFDISGNILRPITPVFGGGNATRISGLEFSGGSDKLFIAGGNGAAVYTLATYTQAPLAMGTTTTLAANTQLELAFDGLIYGASSTGTLLTIDPNTLALAPTTMSVDQLSNFGTGGPAVYGFPDQIDGEYYPAYFGNNTPTISPGLAVDNRFLSPTVFRAAYSCNPLLLTNAGSISADISRFEVVVSATDVNGNLLVGGYNKTFAVPSFPLTLSTLNGGYLADPAHTGYYRVTLIGYNSCQSARRVGLVQLSSLTPGSASYAFNLCTAAKQPAVNTSAAAPAAQGAAGGGGIDITNSSGDFDRIRVRFEQATGGGAFTPIGTVADVAIPANPSTIYLTYLAGQAGLEPGYFTLGHPGYNLVHRLTLTVSNPCGASAPLVGYFQTSDLRCRSVAGPAPVKEPLYPNPLTNAEAGHLRFTLPTAQPVSLVLTEALTGRVRLTVLHDAPRAAGEQEVTFEAAQLPAGVYLYRLTTAGGTTVGRVLKAE